MGRFQNAAPENDFRVEDHFERVHIGGLLALGQYVVGFDNDGAAPFYAPFTGVIVKVKLRPTVSGATGGGPMFGNFINVSQANADLTDTNVVGIAHGDTVGGVEYTWNGNGTEFEEGDSLKFDATSGALTNSPGNNLGGWWLLRRVFPDEVTTW